MPTAAKFTQLSQKAGIGNNRFQKYYKQQIQRQLVMFSPRCQCFSFTTGSINSTTGSLIKKNKTRAFEIKFN